MDLTLDKHEAHFHHGLGRPAKRRVVMGSTVKSVRQYVGQNSDDLEDSQILSAE